MRVWRRIGLILGRVLALGLVLVIAVWIVWTWPWAPIVWLGVLLMALGINVWRPLHSRGSRQRRRRFF